MGIFITFDSVCMLPLIPCLKTDLRVSDLRALSLDPIQIQKRLVCLGYVTNYAILLSEVTQNSCLMCRYYHFVIEFGIVEIRPCG